MDKNHVNKNAPIIWSLRYMIISLILLFLLVLVFSFSDIAVSIIFLLFFFITIITTIIYFPVKYKNLKYFINDKYVHIEYGVYSYKKVSMDLKKVMFISISATPLLFFFRVRNITLKAAGSKVFIPMIDKKTAYEIYRNCYIGGEKV